MAGLGATLVVAGVYLLGWFEPFEMRAYDLRFRWFNRIPDSQRILHVDLDDEALQQVGRWPWKRTVLAELVGTLDQLGAEVIALDFDFTEPQRPYFQTPAELQNDELGLTADGWQTPGPQDLVYPDWELNEAVGKSGRAFLGMLTDWAPPGQPAPLPEPDSLGERVRRYLQEHPTAAECEVHAALLDTPWQKRTPQREALRRSYRLEVSRRGVLAEARTLTDAEQRCLPAAYKLLPSYYRAAGDARGQGFTSIERDELDGVVRRTHLVMAYRGRLIKQLGFAVACHVMKIRDDQIHGEPGWLTIDGDENHPRYRIQLDEKGRALFNWHHRQRDWQKSFQHVPITALLTVWDKRQAIRENERRYRHAVRGALQVFLGDSFAGYEHQLGECLDAERAVRIAELEGRGQTDEVRALRRRAENLRQQLERSQAMYLDHLRLTYEDTKDTQPQDERDRQLLENLRTAYDLAIVQAEQWQQANHRLEQDIQRTLDALGPMVQGKICFVGYVAAALADFVATPVFSTAPGVLGHSNLCNMFLQDGFLVREPTWVAVGLIVLIGGLTTVVTAGVGGLTSLIIVLLAFAGWSGMNGWVAFAAMRVALTYAPVVVAIIGPWVVLTLVRQLTFERQRREMTNYLRQYTSRSLADRLAEDPDPALVRRAEVREVSLYFSDLWGFTPLSERLGAQRTQYLLNRYLERMSEVLDRQEAFINKFIGDAVMAFFNPVLNPQPDHARRACQAALDTVAALKDLIAERLAAGDDPAFADLRVRIGLATGSAVVGDCGSERKADYTCIGDTVNLAARLEPANKVFGTTILCPEQTRRAAGEHFVFRYLAELQVRGKRLTVPVYELMGRQGEVAADQLERADLFAAGVKFYRAADWAQCLEHFEQYLQRFGPDQGAERYLATCRQFQTHPVPDDWVGALELGEK